MTATPLIDLDVHNQEADAAGVNLVPYLSAGWQDFVTAAQDDPGGGAAIPPGFRSFGLPINGGVRKDAIPEDGALAGSDPQLIVDQLLDPFNVQHAILTSGSLGFAVSSHSNPYFAAELARAANEQLVDRWLSYDPRFQGSIVISIQVPAWAADEIRRHADNPRMIQTISAANPLPYGFGHPIFDSVHRACTETGRPFAIHSLGDSAAGSIPSALAGAWPSLYVEFHAGAFQAMTTHLMSFIYHGVFERYREFRLVLVESGVSWIPSVLTRMDNEFPGLRREVPWCKKLPSEYFLEKVTVATQPLDITGSDDPLIAALERYSAQDAIAFSSDYPHWDADTPPHVLGKLPSSWREKVAYGNASRLYNLPVAVGV